MNSIDENNKRKNILIDVNAAAQFATNVIEELEEAISDRQRTQAAVATVTKSLAKLKDELADKQAKVTQLAWFAQNAADRVFSLATHSHDGITVANNLAASLSHVLTGGTE